MLFGDPVEAGEHDGQDDAGVLLDQTHDVFIVPVVKSSLCNLGQDRRTLTETRPHASSTKSLKCSPLSKLPPLPLPTGNKQQAVTDLEMWAGDASGDLFEKWLLDLDELCGFNDVQNLLQFP